jgi:hypothetical protein
LAHQTNTIGAKKVFLKETKAERITDTIVFHHRRITNPLVSSADAIVAAAANLNQTIQDNMKESLTNVDMNELDRLAKIFQEAAQKISETDARQPRVPTRHESSPRVSTNNDEEQNQSDNAPRVETLRADEDDGPPNLARATAARQMAMEDGPQYITRNQKRI